MLRSSFTILLAERWPFYLVEMSDSISSISTQLRAWMGALRQASQRLSDLQILWDQMRGGRTMPPRTELTPRALRPWLGHLALIELGSDGSAMFRLCGDNLMGRFGGEFTNRAVADLGDEVRPAIENYIARVRQTRAPQSGTQDLMVNGTQTRFCELCLPLSDTEERVGMLLFACFPAKGTTLVRR